MAPMVGGVGGGLVDLGKTPANPEVKLPMFPDVKPPMESGQAPTKKLSRRVSGQAGQAGLRSDEIRMTNPDKSGQV